MSEKKAIKLPEKRISIKKIRNHRYVYYIDSYYVTDNGSRTHRDVSIGKLNEEDPTTFFPNKTYWKYFPNTQTTETEIEDIQHAGFSQLVKMLASQLGLDTLLNQHFGHQMDDILAIATFMLAQGNTMMYLDDYYETHYNPYSARPVQRKLGPIYDAITKPKRWAFFKDWQSQIVTEGDYVAYDVSSVSTYGKSIDLAAMGYNRDHENLPQVNVGVFYSQSKQLPICYELYDGSIVDKAHILEMMALAEDLKMNMVVFVMDKGFLTKDNLVFLQEHRVPFLIAFPNSQKIYRQWLLEHRQHLEEFEAYLGELPVFGQSYPITIGDLTLKGFIYMNLEKRGADIANLNGRITRSEEALAERVDQPVRMKKDPYFDIEVNEVQHITGYHKKTDKINEAFKLSGVFGLVSNVANLSPKEALEIYRRRDMIEKHYDDMKNQLEFNRFKTHHQTSTDGKFFIGFIAQIILAYITNQLSTCKNPPVPTFESFVLEMDKIQRITRYDGRIRLTTFTRKQKDILELFNIDVNDFTNDLVKKS